MFKTFKIFYTNFCKENKGLLVLCLIFSFIAGLLEIVGITSVLPFLHKLLNMQDNFCFLPFLSNYTWQQQMVFLGCFVTVLFLVKNFFMIFYHHFTFKFLVKLRDHISVKFLKLIQNARYDFFQKENSDVIINTLDNTLRYVVSVYLFFLLQGLTNYLIMIFVVFLLIFLFPIITIITIVYSFLCFLFIKKIINNPTDKINKNLTEVNKDNIRFLQSAIFSIKELKILKSIPYFFNISKVKSYQVGYLEHLSYFLQTISSNIVEILIMILFFGNMILLLLVTNSYQEVIVSLGLLSVVVFRIAPVANRALTAYSVVKAYNGSVADLNNVYSKLIKAQEVDITGYFSQIISSFNEKFQLKNVSFNYDSSNRFAVQNINITIDKNDFVGVVGLSGAGKTTFIDIILGLLLPTNGNCFIDNHEIKRSDQFSSLFGYVSQNPCIITGTIASNIVLGREIDYDRIKEVMSLCQLNEFTPESEVVEFGKNISGGQKQRIAIARALYGQPKILILDEVTSSLDIVTEKKISDVIDALSGKCTIIAIAHRLGTLKKCNKIFYMQNGQIIANDSFENLYKSCKNFKEMVDLANLTQKS